MKDALEAREEAKASVEAQLQRAKEAEAALTAELEQSKAAVSAAEETKAELTAKVHFLRLGVALTIPHKQHRNLWFLFGVLSNMTSTGILCTGGGGARPKNAAPRWFPPQAKMESTAAAASAALEQQLQQSQEECKAAKAHWGRGHRCPFWLICLKNRGRFLVCRVVQSTLPGPSIFSKRTPTEEGGFLAIFFFK